MKIVSVSRLLLTQRDSEEFACVMASLAYSSAFSIQHIYDGNTWYVQFQVTTECEGELHDQE